MTIWRLTSIVSGARPGAQRGALDAAIELGLGYGGWIPSGLEAHDPPAIYRERLRASSSPNLGIATRLNVQDSDGTLVVSFAGALAGSAAFVDRAAEQQRKAYLHVVLPARGATTIPDAVRTEVLEWVADSYINVLNVAGPLEDEEPGIQQAVRDTLVWVFDDETAVGELADG